MKSNFYTEEELEQFRKQMKLGSELAKAAINKAGGVQLHPKIKALKEKQNVHDQTNTGKL